MVWCEFCFRYAFLLSFVSSDLKYMWFSAGYGCIESFNVMVSAETKISGGMYLRRCSTNLLNPTAFYIGMPLPKNSFLPLKVSETYMPQTFEYIPSVKSPGGGHASRNCTHKRFEKREYLRRNISTPQPNRREFSLFAVISGEFKKTWLNFLPAGGLLFTVIKKRKEKGGFEPPVPVKGLRLSRSAP